jgi:hypothetical protein
MNMNYFFSFFLLMLFCTNSQAQIVLPKIDYDQTKITKTKISKKKEYFKSGKLVLEVFYPVSPDEMNDHCGLSNAVYDSVYFYYTPGMMQYTFSKESGNDVVKWNGRLKEHYGYYPTGTLRAHTKSIVDPDYFSKAPVECGSDKFYTGDFIQFNAEGDTLTYINYSEGIFKNKRSFKSSKKIAELQLKAEGLLKSNLGEDFFSKYVRINYGKIDINWDTEFIRAMSPPLPRGTFPPDNAILDVKFSYILYFTESEQYDLIHIQFDQEGNFVYKPENFKKSLTNGLIKTPFTFFLNTAEALQIAQSIIKDKTEVYINLIWKDGDLIDGSGSYYYQILFNKVVKSESYASTVTFDEVLINATTKELSKIQKYSNKIEAVVEPTGGNSSH